jgi:hypothetical protein
LSTSNYSFIFATSTLTVNKFPLAVTANNASKVYGAAVPTFSATVAGFVNGDSSAVISGAPGLTTTGTASSVVGTYPIIAATGTLAAANYTFTFANGTLTITKAGTITILTTPSGSLSAMVVPILPGAGTPTGTAQFLKGGTLLGTVALTGASAAFPSSTGAFTAIYSGDGNFTGSTSNSVNVYDPYSSSLSLSSSLTPSTIGQAVTFTAALATSGGPPNSPSPNGTVQFADGTRLLGSGTVSNGQATYTTNALAGGWHNITAQYSGDSTWPAASASLGQTVIANVSLSVAAAPAAPV